MCQWPLVVTRRLRGPARRLVRLLRSARRDRVPQRLHPRPSRRHQPRLHPRGRARPGHHPARLRPRRDEHPHPQRLVHQPRPARALGHRPRRATRRTSPPARTPPLPPQTRLTAHHPRRTHQEATHGPHHVRPAPPAPPPGHSTPAVSSKRTTTAFVDLLIAREDNSTQSEAITGPPHDPQTEFEPEKFAAREFRQQKPAGIVKHLGWVGV